MSRMKLTLRNLLAFACVLLASSDMLGHSSALLHDRDLSLVLGGYNNTKLGDIWRDISSAMDNEYAEWFRKEFGSFKGLPEKGNHRNVGHGAPFGKSIPHKYLSAIREQFGEEAAQKVIAKQTELSGRYLKLLMRETGLPRDQAHALMVRASCAHLVGDLTMDNRLFNLVSDFDDICKSDKDAIKALFSKTDPAYAKEFERRINAIQKSGMSVQEKAFAYQKLFAEMRYDEALKRYWGVTLSKYGIDYDIKQALKRDSLLRDKYVNPETAYYGKNGLVRQKGRVRNVKRYVGKSGTWKNVRIVDVPVVVENGKMSFASDYLQSHPEKIETIKKPMMSRKLRRVAPVAKTGSRAIRGFLESSAAQGMTAGVLSFAILEGSTVVSYHAGDLADDEFWRRTTFNAGLATTEGLATVCIAAAMEGAPVLLSLGPMIVAGIAIDKAGDIIWEKIDREVGEFPGISLDELMITVPGHVRERRTIFDDNSIRDLEKRTKMGVDPLKKAEDEELWNKEHPFF